VIIKLDMNYCLMRILMSGAILDMEFNATYILNHASLSWHTDIISYQVPCWKSSSMMTTDRNLQLLLRVLTQGQAYNKLP